MVSPSTRLRGRLAALALLGVLPALALTAYDQTVIRRAAREQTVEENLRLTRLAAAQQASAFRRAARLLEALAQVPGVRATDPRECNATLAVVLHEHPDYVTLGVLTAAGRMTCSSNPASVSLQLGDRPWFRRVLRARATIGGEYQVGRSTMMPDIVVASPLLGPDGRLERVLVAAIELRQLDRLVSAVAFPPGATVTVLDRHRTIVARYPDGTRWVGRQVPAFALPQEGTRGAVTETPGIDGVQRVYVTVPVEAGFDTGLYMGIGVAPGVMFAAADRLRRQQIELLALVALVALGVAMIGGRTFVVGPLDALTETTKRIAAGQFSARAHLVAGAPGLSALAGAVNAMAVALEARQRDREAFQAQLQASEARYRLLFEQNPQPMWVYEPATLRFLEVNDTAIRKYGYARDEFMAMRVSDIRPPEEVDRLMTLLASMPEGLEHSGHWRHRLKSGQIIDVEVVSHGVVFQGTSARFVMAHDVTDRRRIEQRLRETEERLRLALEASHVGVWEVNLQTNVAYWSDTCEVLHGLVAGSFGGTLDAFLDCLHPADRTRVLEGLKRAIGEHRGAELEYRTIWPNGTERQIAWTGRFFYDDTGAPLRGAGVAVDITERRSLETQFRQAQKMESVGQLASGIAHDFNNLLTIINGTSELVLAQISPDNPARADVQEIYRAGERAATLTRQLLAFSRQQILELRVLSLNTVVAGMESLLGRLLGEDIDLVVVLAPDVGHVKVDPGQIEQVIPPVPIIRETTSRGRLV